MKHFRLSLVLLLAVLMALCTLGAVTVAEDAEPREKEIPITESGTFENETLKITVTGVQASGDTLMTVTLNVQNKTDAALSFYGSVYIANGYEISGNTRVSGAMNNPVDPNSEAEALISLFGFENAGMTARTVSELFLTFRYGEPDPNTGVPPTTDPIPVLLDQQPAAPLDVSSGTILYDANDVKLILLGRNLTNTGILVYMENNSDGMIIVDVNPDLTKIDGYAVTRGTALVDPGVKHVHSFETCTGDDNVIKYIDWEIKEVTLAFKISIFGLQYDSEVVTQTY